MAILISMVGNAGVASGQVTLEIEAGNAGLVMSPDMYGIFFEEINHAGTGGIYAEMVENRTFEATNPPAGARFENNKMITSLGWSNRIWFDSNLPGWSLVCDSGAKINNFLDNQKPLNDVMRHSMRVEVSNIGKRAGVANSGYWGMNVKQGELYDLSFYCRAPEKTTTMIVTLENASGTEVYAEEKIQNVGGNWRKYNTSLKAKSAAPHARLVISFTEPGTYWFDVVSLFPRNTYKNRPNGMRADLMKLLADMKPSFLRFPGGCVVEGCTLENRIQWKNTIGDIAKRPGRYDLWSYWDIEGIGFLEYLQMGEDLGAELMYVVNVGMSCQARTPNEIVKDEKVIRDVYAQDMLDALEYAMGPVTSKWGALRASHGRKEPFNIKYVEIGNENSGPDYNRAYKIFNDILKEKYPNIIAISNVHNTGWPIDVIDEHAYEKPEWFFSQAYRHDSYDRNGPKIYMGEYACNQNVDSGNLLAALSEAAFMIGMERNADLVIMCSYAPLFENVNDRTWPVNLIRFDSSRSMGRGSYHVQKLFSTNRPDRVVPTVISGEVGKEKGKSKFYATAGVDNKANQLVIKMVNATADSVPATLKLKGVKNISSKAMVTTLTSGSPNDENTLEDPGKVIPINSTFDGVSAEFAYMTKPWSLTLMRININQ